MRVIPKLGLARLLAWSLVAVLLSGIPLARAQEAAAAAPLAPSEPWSDAALADREAWVAARLYELNSERRQLVVSGRPDYFRRRRALGFTAIGVGAGLAAFSAMGMLFAATAHNSDGIREVAVLGFLGTLGAGVGTLAVGIWAQLSLRRNNVHQGRIDALNAERRTLAEEHRALRREQKERARYRLVPALSSAGAPLLALRVAW